MNNINIGELVNIEFTSEKSNKYFEALIISKESNPMEEGFTSIICVDIANMRVHSLRMDENLACETKDGKVKFTIRGKSVRSEPISRSTYLKKGRKYNLREVIYSRNNITRSSKLVEFIKFKDDVAVFKSVGRDTRHELKLVNGVSVGRTKYGHVVRYFTMSEIPIKLSRTELLDPAFKGLPITVSTRSRLKLDLRCSSIKGSHLEVVGKDSNFNYRRLLLDENSTASINLLELQGYNHPIKLSSYKLVRSKFNNKGRSDEKFDILMIIPKEDIFEVVTITGKLFLVDFNCTYKRCSGNITYELKYDA